MTDANDTTPIRPATPVADQDATDVLFGDSARQGPLPAQAWTAPAASAKPERLRARFGTIFWGVILLVFAAFMVTNAIVPFIVDPGTWIIVALVAGGVLLVAAGIAAAFRRTD
ncbi:hypothetical protein [Mycetocola miduiensis]|uniref:Uncharacterized protein n=1 Tax=Mycetocola miduiensis TaxID=995034 RepID=A0A1I5AXY5_9MICO|nr:hypothetical protein [Mycetocola miduiensis]SFN67313.1 hypothetical protein SAMN05216219_1608 [Mycetocola miduiensis]